MAVIRPLSDFPASPRDLGVVEMHPRETQDDGMFSGHCDLKQERYIA